MTQSSSSNQTGILFTTSKFYMWRCIVAMAHADGMVVPSERAYLQEIFQAMRARTGLSEEWHQILLDDIDTPGNVADFLPYINDPAYRAQIVYFARLLAWKDGVLDPAEEELLKKLHMHVTDGLDRDSIREDVRSAVREEMTRHDAEIDSRRPRPEDGLGLSYLVDRLALHFGIDLMRE